MIKLTATSLIHSISPVIQVSEKFAKRELVLNDSWERNGEVHSNFVLIEFTGESMNILDNYAPGQKVTVEAYVNGREYNGRIFNTIKGASVTPYQPQQQGGYAQPQAPAYQQPSYPQAAPMPGVYPQQPSYPQQQGYGQGYAPAPSYPQNPYGQQTNQPGVADLPFPR